VGKIMPADPLQNAVPPQKLFTFASGGWVLLIAAILTLGAAAFVLYPVFATGFARSLGDGRNPDTFGFDLSNLTVPRDRLIAFGKAKDEIHAVPESKMTEFATPQEVELMARNERIKILLSTDLVIGVVINGTARAYPVRLLNIHEIANDQIDSVPIAVSWSPLCGSAMVFDRRINGIEVEFGVSGLLYQSNLVLFDRRATPKEESLWPQLALKAIAGPLAGTQPTLIRSQLVTWEDWRREHPDTRAWVGLRTLKKAYGNAQDPVNMYLRDDALRFPVQPDWQNANVPRKTPIVVSTNDFKTFTARRMTGPATRPETMTSERFPFEIYTYVFAWHAQHSEDTDYSALK
jgi:hypothetical protein